METDLRQADQLLKARKPADAEAVCRRIISTDPQAVVPRLMLARARQMQGDVDGMLSIARAVRQVAPREFVAGLMQVEALIQLGRTREASALIQPLLDDAGKETFNLARIAELQTQLGDHGGACETLSRAAAERPGDAGILYNLASAQIAVGDMMAAERNLDTVIENRPGDVDAWYNRSTLRKQTRDNNHVEALRRMIGMIGSDPVRLVPLYYALAKELEDIGEYDASFTSLKTGADLRRRNLSYRVETDIGTMKQLAAVFDRETMAGYQTPEDSPGPIFIVGLPRSGTTLVDRILSSHPDVESLGELNDVALAITRLAGKVGSREELVKASAGIDPSSLGAAYLEAVASRRLEEGPAFIDKAPLNYLYIGLIVRALPSARIIHVSRHPLDSAYAMYKTLFRMGYPFSYDLGDLGLYIRAQRELMDHWHAVLPGRITEISYEDLIADQEGESRRLIDSAGLSWDERCLDFHLNTGAAATASAAQVRQPIYSSSVGKWRHFERQLRPVAEQLGLTD